ncbi:leucine-rich repeat domain-containing protein [Flavobacterium piscinae]|uniref:hypothetical protein n=1 Tax=Flavobacterium piscinae TaxID=2506424 RepID=UPI002AAC2A06|nr:hypothetical protein [Flavobacterium piscinae]
MNVHAQNPDDIVNIPDTNFKAKLLSASPSNQNASTQTPDASGSVSTYNKIDVNNDGQIQVSEALAIKYLRLYDTSYGLQPVYTITGLESFTNLESLFIQSYDFWNFTPIANLTNLRYLTCSFNNISNLDVTNLNNLTYLNCIQNSISQTLDVSNLHNLQKLYCNNNPISSINIKNGSNEIDLTFSGCQLLRYICADEEDLVLVQSRINTYGYTLVCQANSYCDFTPGGIIYNIQGSNIFDVDNNGCDDTDLYFPNMKFNISNGTETLSYICNTFGNYTIPVNPGTYYIETQLENSNFFQFHQLLQP